MLEPDHPVVITAIMRNTWTERLIVDGNKVAGQGDRHDIMVEQANKERLPAIVFPFCSGLGNVSPNFLWHTDHTHSLQCEERCSNRLIHVETEVEDDTVVDNAFKFSIVVHQRS